MCFGIVPTRGLRHETQVACQQDPLHACRVQQPWGCAPLVSFSMTAHGKDLKAVSFTKCNSLARLGFVGHPGIEARVAPDLHPVNAKRCGFFFYFQGCGLKSSCWCAKLPQNLTCFLYCDVPLRTMLLGVQPGHTLCSPRAAPVPPQVAPAPLPANKTWLHDWLNEQMSADMCAKVNRRLCQSQFMPPDQTHLKVKTH